ncbi:D-galacturonate reductase-like protein, partial [Tanacetum coccineum]
MVSIPMTTIRSSNGRMPIPLIGMGLTTGGRDSLYGTEKPLAEAIKEALRLGLIKSRTELFITTKLWCNSTQRHLVLPAMKHSLR